MTRSNPNSAVLGAQAGDRNFTKDLKMEISDDYRRGFEDAKRVAIEITRTWEDWDLMNRGRTACRADPVEL